ncbi:MAG: hypothetical protein JJE52_01605 [Acidimicrobiia bacterium]|nr:hypothetical protein [Acidimicrobiia bacterium]
MTAGALRGVAGWLGMDAYLGGGDVTAGRAADRQDEERFVAFRGAASVIEMANELAAGALALIDQNLRYASSAMIRQLIETEYLLTAFALEFSRAADWTRATPDEIRKKFSPKAMRALGGFSNLEYWQHCDMGGHPAPSGRPLLRFNLAANPADDEFLSASVWGDLAQHLRRLWQSADSLLCDQHARYADVRSAERESVALADERWSAADPLAQPVDFALLDGLLEGDGS